MKRWGIKKYIFMISYTCIPSNDNFVRNLSSSVQFFKAVIASLQHQWESYNKEAENNSSTRGCNYRKRIHYYLSSLWIASPLFRCSLQMLHLFAIINKKEGERIERKHSKISVEQFFLYVERRHFGSTALNSLWRFLQVNCVIGNN